MRPVLLLNQSYEPISIINWKKAVCFIFLEKVEVLEEYDFLINSPSTSIRHPAVIRLTKNFRRLQRDVSLTKYNVFARDNWTCQYCRKMFRTEE